MNFLCFLIEKATKHLFFNISTLLRCNYYVYFSNKSLFFVNEQVTLLSLFYVSVYKDSLNIPS